MFPICDNEEGTTSLSLKSEENCPVLVREREKRRCGAPVDLSAAMVTWTHCELNAESSATEPV